MHYKCSDLSHYKVLRVKKMAMSSLISVKAFLALLLFHHSLALANEHTNLPTYIVHVEPPEDTVFTSSEELERWHHSFLAETLSPSFDTKERMVHVYRNVIKGFAARLTPDEYLAIQDHEACVHARPQRILRSQTTHSPNFLGLHRDHGLWKDSNLGNGIVIGVLDTGIFPGHPSFSDDGMPPPPPKWKGKCEFNFTTCNNKLIGARFFTSGEGTMLDKNGHGTHTASTAGGGFVAGAESFGQANGMAAGIAPRAHLAIYKVCTNGSFCPEADTLAAIDTAIEDGVDVLSISLSLGSHPFPSDSIAIGAYRAVQKGILVSCSAGNDGPSLATVGHEAPWILTVGASTVDRKLKASVVLGNKESIEGESIIQHINFINSSLPIIYGGVCSLTSVKNITMEGTIVVCDIHSTTLVKGITTAGAAAVILVYHEEYGVTKLLEYITLPTIEISYADGLKIKAYITSALLPVASLSFQGTVIGDSRAPIVASFSSRGPNRQSLGILKPDIIGPGVNILAAWHAKSTFAFSSGTSMSCPHLSGIAGLLKNVHPDWSPAVIKSAIMTTADVMNLGGKPIEDETLQTANLFATGAGHVNPSRARNPGLVYETEPRDYIPYLCGLNYTSKEVGIITQQKVNCSNVSSISDSQLNYPSFSIVFGPNNVQKYTRTVTNVGKANMSYTVSISEPAGVKVSVRPKKLELTGLKQQATYEVTFTRHAEFGFSQGYLVWSSSSGKYVVRSPILAMEET